jgi:hypothetical protein
MYIVNAKLMEEAERLNGWNKATVEFAIQQSHTVINHIKWLAHRIYKLRCTKFDIDDIYSELLIYLENRDDYAYYMTDLGHVVTLKEYVLSGAGICVKRYITSMYEIDSMLEHENDEYDIFEQVADDTTDGDFRIAESKIDKLETLIEALGKDRKVAGVDMITLIYLKLKTGTDEDRYNALLDILGINKFDIKEAYNKMGHKLKDVIFKLTLLNMDKALNMLRGYIENVDALDRAIEARITTQQGGFE